MTVNDCTFNGTTNGLRLKADRTQGGLVKNITYSNITMTNVQYPILFYGYYATGLPSTASADTTTTPTATEPYWQNITITNLTSINSASNSFAGVIWGLPEAPILNVTMNNVNLSAFRGFEINHARNVVFDTASSITASSGNREISTSSVAVPYDATIVKSGWSDTDIGSPAPLTTSIYDPNTDLWSLIAGGSDIGGVSDQFNLASQDVAGNALVSAKVATIQTANANAKAGVMLRDGTAAGAMFAAVIEMPSKQVVFLYRATTGGSVIASAAVGDTSNAKFVKLNRVGNSFTASYSTNGTSWTAIASPVTIAMPAAAKAGLCMTSANTASTSSASFSGAAVLNDNTPPTLTADSYLFSALNKLTFSFSEDVSASLSTGSLSVVTVPSDGSSATPISVTSMSYNSATNTATFTLAMPLADGNYLATLLAAGTTDPVGNALGGGDAQLPFFVLSGDANRDGVVNALDFNALASHFGSTGALASGDFDFNGSITTADFTILSAHFGKHITPSQSNAFAARPPGATLFAAGPMIQPSVTLADEIIDPLALAGIVL